jgi:hypothetical protein
MGVVCLFMNTSKDLRFMIPCNFLTFQLTVVGLSSFTSHANAALLPTHIPFKPLPCQLMSMVVRIVVGVRVGAR